MNPMVFTIVVRDHELEIERELKGKRRFGTGAISPNGHNQGHASRRSILAWFKRNRRENPRPVVECLEECCYQ